MTIAFVWLCLVLFALMNITIVVSTYVFMWTQMQFDQRWKCYFMCVAAQITTLVVLYGFLFLIRMIQFAAE